MLAVAGIWALQGGGDAAVGAIKEIFSGDLSRILCIVFGVIELLAGVLLIVELFAGDKFGKFDNVLMFIIMIVWIIAILWAGIGWKAELTYIPFLTVYRVGVVAIRTRKNFTTSTNTYPNIGIS
jgi:hypothetical protein